MFKAYDTEALYLRDLVYEQYPCGGGTQLFNALMRNKIDSIEKLYTTSIDELRKMPGIGATGVRRLRSLKRTINKNIEQTIAEQIHNEFLEATGIDRTKINSSCIKHLFYGEERNKGSLIFELDNGATIVYETKIKIPEEEVS